MSEPNFLKKIFNGWVEIGGNINNWAKDLTTYEPVSPTPKIKLCRDCIYNIHTKYSDLCSCPNIPKIVDLVTGEESYSYCGTLRQYEYGDCGPRGRYWKPKVTETT